jgi:hypothetical protein
MGGNQKIVPTNRVPDGPRFSHNLTEEIKGQRKWPNLTQQRSREGRESNTILFIEGPYP